MRNLGRYPAARTLSADQILEYHAARILLLLQVCGTAGAIKGLTKLAKLDFFVRYPDFFRRAIGEAPLEDPNEIESAMVRHHYGPWDHRYYAVLAYLEARELISVTQEGRAFVLSLTERGKVIARDLVMKSSFAGLVAHMKRVKSAFGAKSGDALKKMIYAIFDKEVARLAHGDVIE